MFNFCQFQENSGAFFNNLPTQRIFFAAPNMKCIVVFYYAVMSPNYLKFPSFKDINK